MVQIDGSRGEGGGQTLRSALSLSAWLGKPFRITNIRAGRPEPGLKAQHLAAVRAVAHVCGAEVKGAGMGSQTLTFVPGAVRGGTFDEEVGTAGATTLVAQAAALPLFRAQGTSLLRIRGGTHVAWAPPLDYLRNVYAPFLRLLGLNLRADLLRYGFYPRGGGRIGVEIEGSAESGRKGFQFLKRPPRDRIRIETTAVVSSLPAHIAERMLKAAEEGLGKRRWRMHGRIVEETGPAGTYVFIRVHADRTADPAGGQYVSGGFTGLGEPGKPAEKVAEDAVAEAVDFLESNACLDPRLADQVLLPAVLSGSRLTFTTHRITDHLRTHAGTIARFLGPSVDIEETGCVVVRPPAR